MVELNSLELSPSTKDRLMKSFIAIIGLIIGIIAIVGAVLVEFITDIVFFITIFIGALFIFFSLWRILKFATTRLYIDSEKILYRDRFIWKEISWSEVISVGQANDLNAKDENIVLSKVKALLIMTDNGLRKFDMSSYSTSHGQEIMEKILDSRPKLDIEEEEEEN
ncbi:MAG: hypothetical protein FK733_04580 [Asgard group archaeon]|nr:hypothetical protein [Asgard group archaeon]